MGGKGRPRIDMTGERISYLTVKKYVGGSKWLCECVCGNEKVVFRNALKSAKEGVKGKGVHSCGCMKDKLIGQANSTKRKSNKRLYKVYDSMKQRCLNVNNAHFKHYGGRGIKIHQDWLDDYDSFYYWSIANGYKDDLTIDRIDVNGNYEPSNCRWATKKEQGNNKRNNLLFDVHGKTMTIEEISEKYNIKKSALYYRAYAGYEGNEMIKPSGYFSHKRYEDIIKTNNKSGVPGVRWDKQKGKWAVQIGINGSKIHLGLFETFEEAKKSRREGEEKYWKNKVIL